MSATRGLSVKNHMIIDQRLDRYFWKRYRKKTVTEEFIYLDSSITLGSILKHNETLIPVE